MTVALTDSGVVTRCYKVASELVRRPQEGGKFYISVAENAGVGRSAAFVFRNEFRKNERVEILAHIDRDVRDAECHRSSARIRVSLLVYIVHNERRARDLVPRAHKKRRRDRAVNAAAHSE